MKTSKKLALSYLVLLLCFLLSLLLGRYPLSIGDIINILLGKDSGSMSANVFYNIRLLRSAEVLLAGMALSLAGYLYQSAFHNALVSPDTLGVSGGASVGAIVAILFFEGGFLTRQIFSFFGGILAVLLSLLLAKLIGENRRMSLLLSGVICGALMNSLIIALKYLADPMTQLAVIDYWLMGSFSLINRSKLLSTAVPVIPAIIICILMRHRFKALLLNEEEGASLGVRMPLLYLACIVLSTLLTASVVSVSGIVSWIGLLAPHIVSVLFRSSFEETLCLSLPIGASFLLIADILFRTLSAAEIPVSILTSFLGAILLFVFLFLKRRKAL